MPLKPVGKIDHSYL